MVLTNDQFSPKFERPDALEPDALDEQDQAPLDANALDERVRDLRVVVVDDEPANVMLLEHILEGRKYKRVESFSDARAALVECCENPPDLLLLDWMMPHVGGLQILQAVRERQSPSDYLPVLVLTADSSPATRRAALEAGATDFLTKPLDAVEVVLRVKTLLSTRLLHCRQKDLNLHLEARVRQRTRELEASQAEVLERLAQAAEFRDDDTGQHTRRVGDMAAILAQELGLEREHVELIRRAAPLHDVGKIGVSDTILLKPGKLSDEEFGIIKTHAPIGARLLQGGTTPLIALAERIAASHHERFDGQGYPNKLAGEEIPLEGRIVAVADVFDALTNERPYKTAWPVEKAVAEIEAQAGRQFDPQVVAAFTRLMRKAV
jgi:putative two-component system response regulator